MPLPIPEPGLVISYVYLWRRDYEQGHEEGSKDRPCVIVLTVGSEGGDTVVTVVPSRMPPPDKSDEAVEIPLPPKQRLDLDAARSWVIVSEVNRFVWPGPDLRPISRAEPDRFDFGFLPPALFRQIR